MVHFLTMQLVEGQSLDRVMPDVGFALERLLEIGTALGDALAAAHGRGIIHRDQKRHLVFPGGHYSFGWTNELIKEGLDWLDERFGPPATRP